MKIRNGFVSNSSSASFVLRADISLTGFCSLLYHDFNPKAYKKSIDDEIECLKEEIKRLEKTKDKFHISMRKIWLPQYKAKLKRFIQISEKIPYAMTLDEMIVAYYETNGYTLTGEGKHTELSGFVTMYNSDEDLGKLFLDTEKKLKKAKIYFKTEVHDDH